MVFKKRYRKKRGYRKKNNYRRKRRWGKKKGGDNVLQLKIRTNGLMTEDNTIDHATVAVNWFGGSDPTPANLTIRPLADPQHVDALSRFKYFKITYCKLRIMVNDMLSMNYESFAASWGMGYGLFASDTNPSRINELADIDVIESRPDCKTFNAARGTNHTKGFNALKFLAKHNPELKGWVSTDAVGLYLGNLFYTSCRLQNTKIAADVPIARAETVMYIKYMGYKYNGQ